MTVTLMVPEQLTVGLTRGEFYARWTGLAEWAMSLPLARHLDAYAHFHTVDPDAAGWSGTELASVMPREYIGVTVADFDSAEAHARNANDPSRPELAERHEQALGEATRVKLDAGRFILGTKVPRIEGDEPPAIWHFAFLRRRPHLSREEFLEKWHRYTSANYMANDAITKTLISYTTYEGLVSHEFAAKGYDGALQNTFRDVESILAWRRAVADAKLLTLQDFYDLDSLLTLYAFEDETVRYDVSGESWTGGEAEREATTA